MSFTDGEEVVLLLDDLIAAIHIGQSAFMKPKRRTLEELQTNPNLLSLDPALPQDTVLSFYIQVIGPCQLATIGGGFFFAFLLSIIHCLLQQPKIRFIFLFIVAVEQSHIDGVSTAS